MIEDRLLSVKQVAELLSCCVAVVWRDAKAGILPQPVKYGNYTRWKWSDVQAFIASLQPAEKSA